MTLTAPLTTPDPAFGGRVVAADGVGGPSQDRRGVNTAHDGFSGRARTPRTA